MADFPTPLTSFFVNFETREIGKSHSRRSAPAASPRRRLLRLHPPLADERRRGDGGGRWIERIEGLEQIVLAAPEGERTEAAEDRRGARGRVDDAEEVTFRRRPFPEMFRGRAAGLEELPRFSFCRAAS